MFSSSLSPVGLLKSNTKNKIMRHVRLIYPEKDRIKDFLEYTGAGYKEDGRFIVVTGGDLSRISDYLIDEDFPFCFKDSMLLIDVGVF